MTETPIGEKQIGRNEPCPCGSGKKYKRCCGVGAAPKLSAATPSFAPDALPGGGNLEQFKDQMDPQAMQEFSQMLGRLPKGQLQKLQNIMQRAMAGKDVTREAQEFEHTLPTELQSMLHSMQMPQQAPGMPPMAPAVEMNEEEARRIVETAAKEGKISADEASELLQPKGISKLWKKISGKS